MKSFLEKPAGSYKYLVYKDGSLSGTDVQLTSNNVHVLFFWNSYPSTTPSTLLQLQAKGFSAQQAAKAMASVRELPKSGTGIATINTATIPSKTILTDLETYGLSSAEVETLVKDRSLNGADASASISTTAQQIQTQLTNHSGQTLAGGYTSYLAPALLIISVINLEKFEPEKRIEKLADDLASEMSADEQKQAGIIGSTIVDGWENLDNILQSYRFNLAEPALEIVIYVSWYLNILGYGSWSQSPLPELLGKNVDSETTKQRLAKLLLNDSYEAGIIEDLGQQMLDALRPTLASVEAALRLANEVLGVLVNVPNTVHPELYEVVLEWRANFEFVRFLITEALKSLRATAAAITTYFPRLFDNFQSSYDKEVSSGTSGMIAIITAV
jgi:hypothetical protein